jgi:hypothetical protein
MPLDPLVYTMYNTYHDRSSSLTLIATPTFPDIWTFRLFTHRMQVEPAQILLDLGVRFPGWDGVLQIRR